MPLRSLPPALLGSEIDRLQQHLFAVLADRLHRQRRGHLTVAYRVADGVRGVVQRQHVADMHRGEGRAVSDLRVVQTGVAQLGEGPPLLQGRELRRLVLVEAAEHRLDLVVGAWDDDRGDAGDLHAFFQQKLDVEEAAVAVVDRAIVVDVQRRLDAFGADGLTQRLHRGAVCRVLALVLGVQREFAGIDQTVQDVLVLPDVLLSRRHDLSGS